MSQIIILGISGLAADLLQMYKPVLPNLQYLIHHSPFLALHSTTVSAPLPAWGSIYTGLNPANHKIYSPDFPTLEAEPFWEKAARAGKRVCIFNPLLTSKDRAVEDLVITMPHRSLVHKSSSTPSISLGTPLSVTSCTTLYERTQQQVNNALEILACEAWDLFFVQLDVLDHIQGMSNADKPLHRAENEHTNCILDFYRLFDQIVGHFRAATSRESILAVVSSYGYEQPHNGSYNTHGVFLLENWPAELEIYEDFQLPTVMDVAPTILHLLGVECPRLDGRPLVQPCAVHQLI